MTHDLTSWNQNAQAWVDTVRNHEIESRRVATDAAIVQAILATAPVDALDVGCGEGWLVRELVATGVMCEGLDGSLALVEAARLASPTIPFYHLSYEKLAEITGALRERYQAVICNFSLLGGDLDGVLAFVRARMAPQGNFFVQTVHPCAVEGVYEDGWRSESWQAFNRPFEASMDWYFRTVGSWLSCLQEAHFKLVRLSEPVHPRTGRPLSLLLQLQG